MNTAEITPQLKIQMLKVLVAGHDLDWAANATQIPRDQVLDVVSNHGYPDTDRMKWAIGVLLEGSNKIPQRSAVTTGMPLDRPATRSTNPRSAQSIGNGHTDYGRSEPVRPVHASTAELLHQASESSAARTRGLGAKISTLLADLTSRLADEQAALEAKHQAEKENAAVAAKIAQLEAEIAKLKGKQGKRAKTTPTRQHTLAHGEFSCPTCDRTFTTGQGVALHQRRTHQGYSPNVPIGSDVL